MYCGYISVTIYRVEMYPQSNMSVLLMQDT